MLKVFFALLRDAMFGEPIPDGMRRELTLDELIVLYKLSKMHDISHIISIALEKNGMFPTDKTAAEKFSKQQFLAFYRYEQQNFEFSAICEVLERNGIPYIPLKGAVIRDLYPEPWMRTSCDIDILVHEEDVSRAASVIKQELQYENKGVRTYHDVSLYSPSGVHLELHFNILEDIENIDNVLMRVWDYAERDGDSFRYRLTPEYLLFHIISHIVYHFKNGGCGVRALLDLYILEKKTAWNDAVFTDLLKLCGIFDFYVNIKALMLVWFDSAEHTELTREMERFVLAGGTYGDLSASVAARRSSSKGKFTYFIKRIFQPYEILKIKYPVLKKHKWLTPFCQVRRWFSLIFSGDISRSARELKENAKIDSKQVEKIANFHSRVGL